MCVYKQNRLDLRPLFLMLEVLKVVCVAVYRIMLLLLEVLKVVCVAVYRIMLLLLEVLKVVFVAVYRIMLLILEVLKVVFVAVYRVMLLISEVSKVNSFIYYVLHCMNKRSNGRRCQKTLKIHNKGCNAMYVKRSSKYTTSFLMFNQFSI